MEVYVVDFVELESGNVPFEKFLDSLSLEERAEVLAIDRRISCTQNAESKSPCNDVERIERWHI